MKKKLLNNFGLKLLSIVLAFLLWMTVMIVSDYHVKIEIDNIPVTQINGETLDDLDKIYDVASGDTVDIIIKGRRSIVSELKAEDFVAVADLSKMSITNTVQISVTAKNSAINDEISIACVDNNMVLNLETKKKEQYPVKVNLIGDANDGYAVSNTEVTPNIITIEGPESAINKITDVTVDVNLFNRSEGFNVTQAIKLYDAYGEVIDNDKIKLDQIEAEAKIEIFPVKVVPLEIKTVGNPAPGYDLNEVVCKSREITIVGNIEDLEKVDKIIVDNVSINGLQEDVQHTVKLEKYIPQNIKLVAPKQDIIIGIDVEPMKDKNIALSDKDISLVNIDSKYDYKIITPNSLHVKVVGMENKIADLEANNIYPRIDCSELNEGLNYIENVVFTNRQGVTYELVGSVTVDVTLKEN